MKLSNREKVMIYLLALVLVIAGAIYFLIIPAANVNLELDTVIEEQQANLSMMQVQIQESLTQEETLEATKSTLPALETSFRPWVVNEELDRFITGMLRDHGMTTNSLAIGMPVAGINEAVSRVSVAVSVVGSWEGFIALAEQVNSIQGIRITSFSLDSHSGNSSWSQEDSFSMQMSLEVASYDPDVVVNLLA